MNLGRLLARLGKPLTVLAISGLLLCVMSQHGLFAFASRWGWFETADPHLRELQTFTIEDKAAGVRYHCGAIKIDGQPVALILGNKGAANAVRYESTTKGDFVEGQKAENRGCVKVYWKVDGVLQCKFYRQNDPRIVPLFEDKPWKNKAQAAQLYAELGAEGGR
jgi:hypothetical protein